MEKILERGQAFFASYHNFLTREATINEFLKLDRAEQERILSDLSSYKINAKSLLEKQQVEKCWQTLKYIRKKKGKKNTIHLKSAHLYPKNEENVYSLNTAPNSVDEDICENCETQQFLRDQILAQQKIMARQNSRGRVKGGKTALSLILGVTIILEILFTFLFATTQAQVWKVLSIVLVCLSSFCGIGVGAYLIREDCAIRYRAGDNNKI